MKTSSMSLSQCVCLCDVRTLVQFLLLRCSNNRLDNENHRILTLEKLEEAFNICALKMNEIFPFLNFCLNV